MFSGSDVFDPCIGCTRSVARANYDRSLYPYVCIQAPAVYAREDVPKGSPEWRRVQQKLSSSLPGAELMGLERVKNPHTWQRFQLCLTDHEEGDWHMDFTRAGSAVKELWHVSGATDILCKSKIGLWLCLAAAVC